MRLVIRYMRRHKVWWADWLATCSICLSHFLSLRLLSSFQFAAVCVCVRALVFGVVGYTPTIMSLLVETLHLTSFSGKFALEHTGQTTTGSHCKRVQWMHNLCTSVMPEAMETLVYIVNKPSWVLTISTGCPLFSDSFALDFHACTSRNDNCFYYFYVQYMAWVCCLLI